MCKRLLLLIFVVLVLAVTGTASADLIITVPDAGFDDHVLNDVGDWIYVGDAAYTGAWKSAGGDAWIDYGYYAGDIDLPALSGNNKLYPYESTEDYVYQILDETFVEGKTYKLSVWVGIAWAGYDDNWSLYFTGEDHGVNLGEISGNAPVETWEQVSLVYTATADDAGKKIGIKMTGAIYVTFEDVTLTLIKPALYVWNGGAGDGLWETPANWSVTDSLWTWPNEETGGRDINLDALAIDIIDGSAVTRGDRLHIQGADELAPAVLTLDNASSLTVSGRLSIGMDGPGMGELNVLGGSTLTILAGDNGDDLYAADDANSTGTINIVDSNVAVFDDIVIDSGEGYINISGNSIVTVDDVTIGDNAIGVGILDISGTATVTLGDDFRAGQNGKGTVNISGDATLDVPDELEIANNGGSEGEMNVSGNATVNIGDDLNVGDNGPGICNIGDNATVNIADDIYVAHNVADGAFESHMTISGNATVNVDDFIVANNAGLTGYLEISGNPTISVVDDFIMNDDSGDGQSFSQVIMNGGTVNIGDQTTFNDDNNGTAEFIMNGGRFYSDDDIYVSDNLDGTAHLTINGGKMITGDNLKLGEDGGEDTGQARVFINGGVLQAEGLSEIKITDSKIIITGGLLRIRKVSEDDIWQMIADGTIIADSNDYIVATDGDYTILGVPVAAWSPSPADGTTGMSTTPTISTYISDDAPKPIPDWQGTVPNILGKVISTLDVPDSVTIIDLNVELDISKPGNNADLNVYLTSPDGKEVELFTDVGFLQSNFRNTILDDEASKSIKDGSAPFTGIYKPEGRLRDFDGRNSAGTWQLKIEDDWPGGPGTLNAWQLVVESRIPLSWTPGVDAVSQDVYFSDNFDQVNDRAGAALLRNVAGDVGTTGGGALEWDTTYYWCVDAIDANDNVEPGDIWSFSTAPSNAGADVRIDTGDDDVEEKLDSGDLDVTSSDYEMPYEDWDPLGDPQRVAMRFVNVGVPAGSQILEAYIEFVVDESAPRDTGVETVNLLIDAQLTGDAEPFVEESFNVSNRSFIETVVPWSVEPWPTAGEKKQTPDISALVEELINLEDWVSGNAMVFTIQDDPCNPSDGIRAAESANGVSGAAPLLHILGTTEYAHKLSPADGAVDVPQDTFVSWEPGLNAVARNVYFGTKNPPAQVGIGTTTGIGYDPGKLAVSTTYYVKVDEIEADGTKHEGPVWSFTTIIGEATNPDPADAATDVSSDVVLSWTPGATAVSHDAYFGTTSPPEFVGNTTENSLDTALVGGLKVGRTYYWRLDAIEADGTTHVGNLWSFSTVSGQASQPDPADGALVEQTFALLAWTAGLSAASHDVYISDNLDDVIAGAEAAFAGNQTETSLTVGLPETPLPDGLVGATYYWRVDAVEDDPDEDPNMVHQGKIWSFTVPPLEAYDPSPADAAENVDAASVTLSWTPGLGALLHTVYFGDDLDTITNAAGGPPLPLTTFSPGPLETAKTYYWRIDEFSPPNTIIGTVWSFTTAP